MLHLLLLPSFLLLNLMDDEIHDYRENEKNAGSELINPVYELIELFCCCQNGIICTGEIGKGNLCYFASNMS
jgi:hypothetical protein